MKLEISASLPKEAVMDGKVAKGDKNYSRINTPTSWAGHDFVLVDLTQAKGFHIVKGKED
jgi:hypothetical protein